MSKGKPSYCIKHDSRVASARCKQCHKPLCGECALNFGGEGVFCSEKCHMVFERFSERVKNLPGGRRGSGLLARLSNAGNLVLDLAKWVAVAAVVVAVLLFTGKKFKLGLRYVPGKTPVPIELVLPGKTTD